MKSAFTMSVVAGAFAGSLNAGAPTNVTYDEPTFDRWMYPFNGTPGTRAFMPTFGALGFGGAFDERDGQVLLGFDTSEDIMSGLQKNRYRIISATVTCTIGQGNTHSFDPTLDDWQTFITQPDTDTGRPVILTGTGFRNDFTAATFGETGPYGGGTAGTRNAYAASFDDNGDLIDVSNNVTDGFNPLPFAMGMAESDLGVPLAAGDSVPLNAKYVFDVDVSNLDIECYLREGLEDGIISLSITSLTDATNPTLNDPTTLQGVTYPQWRSKEDPEVVFGLADAATLNLTVEVIDEVDFRPADVLPNGTVNIDDLLAVINAFGEACNCCPEDVNASGVINIDDLLDVINDFDT
ncbi:MAG: hypothetical protein AAF432_15100 [Planctomycetota bacterium]